MSHGKTNSRNSHVRSLNRASSTLLNETGNIQLYRISDETKRQVAEDSARIRKNMEDHNARSRQRFKKLENERLRRNELSRQHMTEKWERKTKTNPLNADQTEIEDRRIAKAKRISFLKREHAAKLKAVDDMIGTVKFDPYDIEGIKALKDEPENQLALLLRRSVDDRKVIKRERRDLDMMMQSELARIQNQFPVLANKLPPVDSNTIQLPVVANAVAPTEPEQVDDDDNDTDSNRSTASAALLRHKERLRQRIGSTGSWSTNNSTTVSDADSSSAGLQNSSSMYKGPSRRMQQFEDDLDLQFNLT